MTLLAAMVPLLFAVEAFGQRYHDPKPWRPPVANVIMPQARPVSVIRAQAVEVTAVEAEVVVKEQVATVELDIKLRNPAGFRQEAELLIPVPDGAVVRGFDFLGSGKEPSAVLLPKEEAKRIYNEIVAKTRDPALLEFIGWNLVRSSVFPVEPYGVQAIRLTYEDVLAAEGNRIDLELPRSESIDYTVPWTITVEIDSKQPISTVYSPSHELDVKKKGDRHMVVKLGGKAVSEPGPFRLSYLVESDDVSASLFAYPDPKIGGGYFLMLAGLPATIDKKERERIKREVILVMDRSGSMVGEKLDQAVAAARQVVGGLNDGEAFNLVVYNEGVDVFSTSPVIKGKDNVREAYDWLSSVTPRGGTNIHDALVEALRMKATTDTLPIVLFLTDGLPTIGQTSERIIRELAVAGNPSGRRVFTFGVGPDVNAPLLSALAAETRATSTFVLPREDVEVKVARVFSALAGPVLSAPMLCVIDDDERTTPARLRDVLPRKLPDMFEGDQLVVLGQYVGEDPLTFMLQGNLLGKERTHKFSFDPGQATTRNNFVPRIWASRKIAVLIEAIRQAGADLSSTPDITVLSRDPRFKELVDEIVKLSTEFGILTEYTSFLAREGTNLAQPETVYREVQRNLVDKAMRERSGMGAVAQSVNAEAQRKATTMNRQNTYFDSDMNEVRAPASVQQVADTTLYRRGNRWVESRVEASGKAEKPAKVYKFGSEEFGDMAIRLSKEGRQGSIAKDGEVMLEVGGEAILFENE
jgi:Ca-activated chloride channel family protein